MLLIKNAAVFQLLLILNDKAIDEVSEEITLQEFKKLVND